MFSPSTYLPLAALALVSKAVAQDLTCQSFGVDFQNGGEYFINTLSNANFTSVTQFSGCNNDTASVILVDPNEDSYECSDIATPDNVPEMSTCDLEKSQMFSGEWEILVLGNNGPDATDAPFAFQRVFSLDCGPQATATVTPTITYSATITPIGVTVTNTSTVYTTFTQSPTTTVVVPASTHVITTTPKAVTTTSFATVTKTYRSFTSTKTVITKTRSPVCTVPARAQQHDPICTVLPKGVHLPPGLNIPGLNIKRDIAVDSAAVIKRFEAIKARKAAANAQSKPRPVMLKRDADQPTVTITATSPVVNYTTTFTAVPSTAYNLTLTTISETKTLPPTTIHSGIKQTTVTAPTPTKTVSKIKHTAITLTKTLTATLTHTTVVCPTATVLACKKQGGHFGPLYAGWW